MNKLTEEDLNEINVIHADIFQAFIENIPDVVYTMKNCDHGYHIHIPNDYHMEGDVWTHTCIAYQSLLYIPQFYELDYDQRIMACIAVLCHDIGKPYKKFLNESNRYRFGGHEKRSVVEMINILNLLLGVYRLSSHSIYNLMLIVSAHSEYWLRDSLQEVFPLLNYNMETMEVYKVVATADQRGQICKSSHIAKRNIYDMEFTKVDRKEFDQDRQTIFMMIGAPGSGKDHVINEYFSDNDIAIVSYDKIRLDLYYKYIKESTDIDFDKYILNTTADEVYSHAWKWINDTKFNLDDIMINQILDALLFNKNVAISNTNMSIKTRAKLINKLRQIKCTSGYINIIGCFVYMDDQTLIERDINRGSVDKTVGAAVIHKMCNQLEIPTMQEGFDNIMTFINY